MFEPLFDLSLWIVGPVIIGAFYRFPVGGLLLGIKRLPKRQELVPRKPVRLALRLFLFLVVMGAPVVSAQESTTRNEFWPAIDVYVDVKPKLRLYFMGAMSKSVEDGELRKAKGFESQIGAHIDYILNEHFILRTGYRFGTSLGQPDEPFKEHRLLTEQTLRKLIPGGLMLSDRNREDFRFVNGDFSFRYRNRVTLEKRVSSPERPHCDSLCVGGDFLRHALPGPRRSSGGLKISRETFTTETQRIH